MVQCPIHPEVYHMPNWECVKCENERERAAQRERRKREQERVEKKKQEAESFWGMKKAKKH